MTLDEMLGELEAKARAATPGKRYVAPVADARVTRQFVRSKTADTDYAICECWGGGGPSEPDAAYIAALAPETVTAFIAAVRALEKADCTCAAESDDSDHSHVSPGCYRCDALATLTRALGGEP